MGRTVRNFTRPDFLVEKHNAARDFGHQVNWSAVDAAKENEFGNKELKAGTFVSVVSGKIVPRDDVSDAVANPAMGILVSSANQHSDTDSHSGYGIVRGGIVIEDMMITGSVSLSDAKSELQSNSDYGFNFESYSDDR